MLSNKFDEVQIKTMEKNMFSMKQKREIAEKVQQVLRDTAHPELPEGEIQFALHVDGADNWSWADIRNNGDVIEPGINPYSEML